jgi:Flp pilus assembly protein TadG
MRLEPALSLAFARRLAAAEDGATLVEFALLAPVLLMLLMGIFDMGYNIYATVLLNGTIQEAARDSTLESASSQANAIDKIVTDSVRAISPNATITFDRKAYTNFGDVSEPEDFTDVNNDGICDNGEPFEDVNGNGTWDTDRGIEGMGGARDAVLYTVTVRYPRVFPIANLIGLPPYFETHAQTVLRNQPYGEQASQATVRYCP